MYLNEHPFYIEITEEYCFLRQNGESRTDAIQLLTEEYACEVDDADDGAIFWIAVAVGQMAKNELMEKVRKRIPQAMEHLLQCGVQISEDILVCEAKQLTKRMRKPAEYACDWKINDVFALPMRSSFAKEWHLDDAMLLIRMIGFTSAIRGVFYPIVYRMIWLEPTPPQTVEDINSAGYLRSTTDPPWRPQRPPEHRIEIIDKSKTEFEQGVKDFVYLGNFPNALEPANDPDYYCSVTTSRAHELEKNACIAFHQFGIDYL